MDTFKNRFNTIIRLRNIKPIELSEKTGIPKSAISQYMSGLYEPKQKNIYKLCKILDVSEPWLMGLDVPMERMPDNLRNGESSKQSNLVSFTNNMFMVPVYGKISAGLPDWAEQDIEGMLPIDPDLFGIINPQECFFLRVNGESMNKVIKNGSFALIRKQDYVDNGEIAAVLVNGYDATLKKFTKQDELVILEPQSNDESFKTQVYDKNTRIQVLGKYIGKMEINE